MNILKKKKILFLGIFLVVFSTVVFFNWNLQSQAESEEFYPDSDEISQVLNQLQYSYVDPERLDGYKIMRSVLERLAFKIPPVVLHISEKEKFKSAVVQVEEVKKKFNFKKLENLKNVDKAIQEIVIFIKRELKEKDSLKAVEYQAIRGILSPLDPHTVLFVPEAYTEFQADTKGIYSGVGMYIGFRGKQIVVISPIVGSPAFKAGLQAQDEILQIDGESTSTFTVGNASQKIRGEVGTKVKILINRKGFSKPKQFILTREKITVKSVNALVLKTKKGRIGYISLSRFQQNTTKQLEQALNKINYSFSDFQGIILDLRNNPGGLLSQAIKVSDKFLNRGVIVSTSGARNESKKTYNSRWYNTVARVPLVVLVNSGSASASEIVSAALKQNNRALILGKTTYGKGSVQQLHPFKDGSAIKMTISKYLTPNDTSIQSIGVTPHIELNPLVVSKNLIQIVENDKYGAKSLQGGFTKWGDVIDKSEKKLTFPFDNKFSHSIFSIADDRKANSGFDIVQLKKDYPLYLAAKILTASHTKKTNEKLELKQLQKNAYEIIDMEKETQTEKLSEKLNDLNIKWTKGGSTKIKTKTHFWVEIAQENKKPCLVKSSNKEVTAGDEIYFCAEVENLSSQESAQLQAIITSNIADFSQKQFVFGNLKPQEKKMWYVPVTIHNIFSETEVFLKLHLSFAEEKVISSQEFSFHINEIPQSFLGYEIQAYNAEGKKKAITPSSKIKLELNLKNISKTDSGIISISLKNGEGNKVLLTEAKASIPVLKKGQSEKIQFEFILQKALKDKKIDLSLSIKDNTYLFGEIEHNFSIAYEEKQISTIQNSPSIISVQDYPLVSKKRSVVVDFNIEDDTGVESVFIIQNGKKIFYRRFEEPQVKDKVSLKLEDGLNIISILSRDDFEVVSRKKILIQKR